MASTEELLAQFTAPFTKADENRNQCDNTLSGVEGTVAEIDRVRGTAEELRDQSVAIGYEDKAAVISEAITKTEEARNQLEAAKQSLTNVKSSIGEATETLREAQTLVQSLNGLLSGGHRSAPTTRPLHSGPPEIRLSRYPRGDVMPPDDAAMHHVCHGNTSRTGGGHLSGTGNPGKTEFPDDWKREDIREALFDVARSMESTTTQRPDDSWYATGWHRDVKITAVVSPTGRIKAGWPKEGPGVVTNPTE